MDEPQLQSFSSLGFREKLAQNKKAIAAFVGLLILAGLVIGAFTFFVNSSLGKVVQLAIFLALGYMHVSIMRGNLAVLAPTEKLIYSLFLTLTILIALSVANFVTGHESLVNVLACGCVFLLPFILKELWRMFTKLASGEPVLWYYSDDLMQKPTVFLNSMHLRFKIQLEQHGLVEHRITFRAPAEMQLGTVFFHTMQDQENKAGLIIDLIDNNKQPYGWVFFTKSWGGWPNYLNPEETLAENKVKKSTVVIARRISQQTLSEAQGFQKKLLKNIV